jgi:hypothetical protein
MAGGSWRGVVTLSNAMRRALMIALLSCFVAHARAEISAVPKTDGRADTMVMGDVGITDGVDPIPQIWQDYRSLPQDWILNPAGVTRGDGRPDVFIRRNSGWPVVVWAFNRQTHYDIAISFWQGNAWGPIEFLTDTPENEVDPRVFVEDDGTVHVVWWVDGPDSRVELKSRYNDTELWQTPQQVTTLNEPGRRPSVAVFDDSVWVAYERNATESPFNVNEVAVRSLIGGDTFALEYVADTEWQAAVDPILHVRNRTFWMDWRYSETQFAYANLSDLDADGAETEDWNDPSWVGIESVRRIIATLIHSIPGVAPAEPNE